MFVSFYRCFGFQPGRKIPPAPEEDENDEQWEKPEEVEPGFDENDFNRLSMHNNQQRDNLFYLNILYDTFSHGENPPIIPISCLLDH